jgi:hypothetical protein
MTPGRRSGYEAIRREALRGGTSFGSFIMNVSLTEWTLPE